MKTHAQDFLGVQKGSGVHERAFKAAAFELNLIHEFNTRKMKY